LRQVLARPPPRGRPTRASNLMPTLIDAATARVTVGESMSALESVFGTWYERTVV